jgi:hypothetical protein
MRTTQGLSALLLMACGQGDYSFSVENDVTSPVPDSGTDSAPIVWEDCGIAAEPADTVPVDHSCTSSDGLAVDLKIAITDVCFPSCEEGAPVFVAIQITNQGGVDVTGQVPVAVYKGAAGAGTGDVPLLTWSDSGGIPAGGVAEGAVLEFDVNALNGEPIRVEVNDDGTGEWSVVECSLDNNRAVWEAIPCVGDE